jgi:hypothetical protein
MSALAGLAVNGAILMGNGPVDHWSNGIPYNAAGRVVMVNGGLVLRMQNGIPFDADGAIPYTTDPPDHWTCGLPIGILATRHLCISISGTADHYSSGTPFAADGRVQCEFA